MTRRRSARHGTPAGPPQTNASWRLRRRRDGLIRRERRTRQWATTVRPRVTALAAACSATRRSTRARADADSSVAPRCAAAETHHPTARLARVQQDDQPDGAHRVAHCPGRSHSPAVQVAVDRVSTRPAAHCRWRDPAAWFAVGLERARPAARRRRRTTAARVEVGRGRARPAAHRQGRTDQPDSLAVLGRYSTARVPGVPAA